MSLEGGVFTFLVVRNEILGIKHCLELHRKLGVRKLIVVDNGSDDGTFFVLRDQPDVILSETRESYNKSRNSCDWRQYSLDKYEVERDEVRFVLQMIEGLDQEAAERAALGLPLSEGPDFADILRRTLGISHEAARPGVRVH